MKRSTGFSKLLLLTFTGAICGLIYSYALYEQQKGSLYASTADVAFSMDLARVKKAGSDGDWNAAHQLLKDQSKSDNPLAKLEYALLHLNGWGTKRDLERARLLLLQAVQYDFPDRGRAAYELGKIYRLSKGSDCARIAFEWFSKAVKWRHLKAHNELGKSYARGFGVTTDYNQAIRHYRHSIENGSTSAVVPLFEIAVQQQQYGNADSARGAMMANKYLPLLEVEAQEGNRIAARALGRIYARGLFVITDIDRAAKWFALAASNGDAVAMHDLALLGTENELLKISLNDALRFLKDSAELGHPAAMTALGRIYLKDPIVRNAEQAISYLEMGAKAGHAGSMAELAKLYFEGKHVQKNMEKAKAYATLGVIQKHSGSRRILLKIEAREKESQKLGAKTIKDGKV